MMHQVGCHEAGRIVHFYLRVALLLSTLVPALGLAQIPTPAHELQVDSLHHDIADTVVAARRAAFLPSPIGFRMDRAATSTHLFQDFIHLASQTVPVIPLITGEVGQPRYWAVGDLPPRAVQIVIDEILWIPGVYGTVDLTGLAESHVQLLETRVGETLAPELVQLASDSLNFSTPFSRIEYAKGPFGADAVRFQFGRALGKRLAAYLNSTFSNSEGQFADRPYDGRKANLQLDYFLNRNLKLRYRHLNSRHEAGLGAPFFPEEWPGISNAFHKEERLYHGLELLSSENLRLRGFIWQVKEELNDPARGNRHRLLDGGADLHWQKQTGKWAVQLNFGAGLEAVKSTSIDDRERFYERVSATFGWRITPRTRLQLGGQASYKTAWPIGAALQAELIRQSSPSLTWWLGGGLWKIPPALGERDNTLPHLAMNRDLQPATLQRGEIGMKWRRRNFALQFFLHGSVWKDRFVFQANPLRSSGALFNSTRSKSVVATQLDLNWKVKPRWHVGAIVAQPLNGLPGDFWFWHQPEGYGRVYLETLRNLFGGDLEILPRLAGRFIGKRYSPSFATDAVKLLDHNLPKTAVLDFQIRLRHGDGALLFSWENILNQQFDWRFGVPAVGRYLRWGFWWNFLN
ncbi:MAG: hypothetical protein ONB46_11865 [candidate division KSB1 bacterium]|nr:hypothetical protein [candidate division KSB1 bacterium]MDZ7366687.1 hypothetical protein [candidate division KSB1 bacterium]MDZ7404697.1 hypothetical protein [candidate division KSB1 bacterium]